MKRGVVAQSTAQQYATANVKLCNFVKRKWSVSGFYARGCLRICSRKYVPRGTIGKVQAAYPSLADITTGVRQSVHWPYSSQARATVLSIQRDIAAKRPAVGYDFTVINILVAAELVTHLPHIHTANALSFWSLSIAVVIYLAFFRCRSFFRTWGRKRLQKCYSHQIKWSNRGQFNARIWVGTTAQCAQCSYYGCTSNVLICCFKAQVCQEISGYKKLGADMWGGRRGWGGGGVWA